MRLIRAHEIRLKSDSEKVTAFIQDAAGKLKGFGTNVGDVAGSGADVPAALEDLARRIRGEGAQVSALRWAKQWREGEAVNVECPECGHITDVGDFAMIVYMCEGCGEGIYVEPLRES